MSTTVETSTSYSPNHAATVRQINPLQKDLENNASKYDILGVVLMDIMSRCRKTRGDFRLEMFRRALPRIILLMRKIQGCIKANPRAEFGPADEYAIE